MKQRNSRTALSIIVALFLAAGCGSESPEKQLASAKEYLQKNDPKSATIQIKNALQANPGLGEARFLLGTILLKDGSASTAEVEFRKALAAKYPNDLVVPELARSMLMMGQEKKLVDEFGATKFDKPGANASLQTTLAAAYGAMGKPDLAQAALSAALAADPDYAPARLVAARQKAAGKDFEAAQLATEEVLAKDPANADGWKLKGDLLLFSKRDVEGALAAYRKSIEVDPKFGPGHVALMTLLLQQQKLDEAATQLAQLKKLAPKSPADEILRSAAGLLQEGLQVGAGVVTATPEPFSRQPAHPAVGRGGRVPDEFVRSGRALSEECAGRSTWSCAGAKVSDRDVPENREACRGACSPESRHWQRRPRPFDVLARRRGLSAERRREEGRRVLRESPEARPRERPKAHRAGDHPSGGRPARRGVRRVAEHRRIRRWHDSRSCPDQRALAAQGIRQGPCRHRQARGEAARQASGSQPARAGAAGPEEPRGSAQELRAGVDDRPDLLRCRRRPGNARYGRQEARRCKEALRGSARKEPEERARIACVGPDCGHQRRGQGRSGTASVQSSGSQPQRGRAATALDRALPQAQGQQAGRDCSPERPWQLCRTAPSCLQR